MMETTAQGATRVARRRADVGHGTPIRMRAVRLVASLAGGVTRIESHPAVPPTVTVSVVLAIEPDEFGREYPISIKVTTPSGAHPVDVEGTVTAKGDPDGLDGLTHYVPFQLPLSRAELMTELGTHTVEVELAGERRQLRMRVSHPLEPIHQPRVDVEITFHDVGSVGD